MCDSFTDALYAPPRPPAPQPRPRCPPCPPTASQLVARLPSPSGGVDVPFDVLAQCTPAVFLPQARPSAIPPRPLPAQPSVSPKPVVCDIDSSPRSSAAGAALPNSPRQAASLETVADGVKAARSPRDLAAALRALTAGAALTHTGDAQWELEPLVVAAEEALGSPSLAGALQLLSSGPRASAAPALCVALCRAAEAGEAGDRAAVVAAGFL
eukprot:Hpha_TRINITY_DN4623_c0_g1::TRINITY_DN4623_c0_g1_i1::g.97196::m.97196